MKFLKYTTLLSFMIIFTSCNAQSADSQDSKSSENQSKVKVDPKWDLSEEEWKSKLTEMEYYVLREKGTERAFTGEYWDNKKEGTYYCRACDLPLFNSDTKYKSGTGWPSFWQPLNDENVAEEKDYSLGMIRTEVLCARCGGHLGHVFPDGPQPTGQRYCLNSVSLTFKEN